MSRTSFVSALVMAAVGLSVLACSGRESGRSEPLLEPVGPAVTRGSLTVTPIRFGTKNDAPELVEVDAELGRLEVPERHAQPDGPKIAVRYVRLPAKEGANGAPIVYLSGGPGGSGVWSASGDRFPLFDRLRDFGDVIAYDQRGTWGTEPYLVCPGSWDYPLDRPMGVEVASDAVRPYLEECYEHWSETVDLSAFNTLESAGDLEALRVALGAEQLTLWGISYGTHLGLAYLREYPDRVHRAILAGVEGPDDTYKLPERVDAAFLRVVERIEADSEARASVPDFLDRYRELLSRLTESPVSIDVEDPESGELMAVVVGPEELRAAANNFLGEREDIQELLAAAAPVLGGDLTAIAEGALESRRGNRRSAMALSMDCASGVSEERRALIQEQTPGSLLGNRSWSLWASCPHWPVADLGDDFREPVVSDVPVLFVSGSLDGKTPVENGLDALGGFANGRHLVVDGGSHDDDLLVVSPEILEAIVAFLDGREPPGRIDLGPLEFDLP